MLSLPNDKIAFLSHGAVSSKEADALVSIVEFRLGVLGAKLLPFDAVRLIWSACVILDFKLFAPAVSVLLTRFCRSCALLLSAGLASRSW